ncbi:aKG-HExxH-type peptide beta-hydroxylase [Nocardia sp. NPDC049149]|uniref:aKG-HExxH-type peptide beta-hydroxylase n=1 Tax=Nocardia sp. NPDC049149 TaxID=3364315 RepID=UPI0037113B54
MYSLVGAREIMQNLVVLTSAEGATPHTFPELRRAYRALLLATPRRELGEDPSFVGDGDELAELVRGFDLPQRQGDGATPAPAWRLEKAVSGWRHLRQQDEALGTIAATVVGTVFVTGADWAGSMSDHKHIGTVWLMPGRSWHMAEVTEAYVHELTHTLLFLDERRYGHFLPGSANVRVRSAIRQDDREYPGVVHSMLVAAELLDWRVRHHIPDEACRRLHGPTAALRMRAAEAHEQIVAEDRRHNLLTPRMRELVERAGHTLYAPAQA